MEMLGPYERVVQYYETDMMGIVHHSNYIRWFEEARVWALLEVGYDYRSIEDRGILMPVLSVESSFRKSFSYGDTFQVYLRPVRFNGLKLSYEYEIRNKATGEVHTTGSSTHCFLDRDMNVLNIRKVFPEFYTLLKEQTGQ